MNREQQEQKFQKACGVVHGFADWFVKRLNAEGDYGRDWSVVPPWEDDFSRYKASHVDIRRTSDGAGLRIYTDDYPQAAIGRIKVMGFPFPLIAKPDGRKETLPIYNQDRAAIHEYVDSISVSGNRPASEIGKEVKRRLLPGYLKMFARLQEQAKEAEGRTDQMLALRDQITQRLGKAGRPPHDSHMSRDTIEAYMTSEAPGYGDIIVNGPASVTMKLHSLPGAVALAIADVLCKWAEDHATTDAE